MTTVYLVTSGEYSGYGVDAVFDDQALAAAWIEANTSSRYDRYRIEEFPLNPGSADLAAGRGLWRCVVGWATGDVDDVMYWGGGDEEEPQHPLREPVVFTVRAKDREHAQKVAGERVARMKASGEWERL